MKILAFLLLTSCGSMSYNIGPWEVRQCGPTFYTYDKDTDPSQREQIIEAFSYFNKVLDRKLWVDAGPSSPDEMPVSEAITRVKYKDNLSKNEKNQIVCGLTEFDVYPSGCIVNTRIFLSLECEQAGTVPSFQTKIRHEVGHATGLINHNDDPEGLMYYSSPSFGDKPRELSSEELEVLLDLYPEKKK